MAAENPTLPARRRTSAEAPEPPEGPGAPGDAPGPRPRRAPAGWSETPVGWWVVVGLLTVLLVLVGAALVERIAYRGDVLPGVDVAGLDVAGRSAAATRRAVEGRARALATEPLAVRINGRRASIPADGIGARVDVDSTVRSARRAGRSRNPVDQIVGVVLRRFRPDRVDLDVDVDEARLRRSIEALSPPGSSGVVEGGLRFEGARVVVVTPRAGQGVDVAAATARIERELRRGSTRAVDLPRGRIEPTVGLDAVRRAAARARAILSAPVVIDVATTPPGAAPGTARGARRPPGRDEAGASRPDAPEAPPPTPAPTPAPMTLAPEQVGPLLGTEARNGELEIVVDTARLRGVLSKPLAAIETAPVDATFAVDGASVSVVPSTPGRKADLEAVGDAIARGSHRVTAPVVEKQPAHDTAWARKLNITELVSSFTTHYPCCPPRVANIKRAVATLDGAIVEPGEVFSLNERLGPRTAEKGYVKAPAIAGDLSYFEDYGGGVSQVSTTLFNATFFGGYEDVSHAAHSLYISRYPMGREATINWPGLDNKFRNDSKSGVLIKAWAGSTSITVSYYGNKEGRTVRAEGPNILETIEPTTEYVEDPTVPPDEEREVQSGYRGYVVENFRIISRPGREDVRQRFVVRYSMRPRKIARAPAPRAPDPAHPPRPGAPSPKPTSPTTEPPST